MRSIPDGVLGEVEEGEAPEGADGVGDPLELAALEVEVLEAGVEAAHRVVGQGEVVVGQLERLEAEGDEGVVGHELDAVAAEVEQADEPQRTQGLHRHIPEQCILSLRYLYIKQVFLSLSEIPALRYLYNYTRYGL